jgi:hypothetical protein
MQERKKLEPIYRGFLGEPAELQLSEHEIQSAKANKTLGRAAAAMVKAINQTAGKK